MSKPPPSENPDLPAWLTALEDQDIAFLKRFLLASGSLKELAKTYGVSYPTIRIRLDRLIETVKIHDTPSAPLSPFERQLKSLLADGRIDTTTFKLLRKSYQDEHLTTQK